MKLVLFALLFCYVLLAFGLTRYRKPQAGAIAPGNAASPASMAGDRLSVCTWNIGYAGLGAEADFFVDGGKNIRALGRDQIDAAAWDIAKSLAKLPCDVMLLQENAGAGFMTRGVPLRQRLDTALSDCSSWFWADLATRLLPRPLRFDHGLSTYARLQGGAAETLSVPQEDSYYFHFLRKYYGGLITRFPIGGSGRQWTVINIHLSAFDEGAKVRSRQFDALMALATAEHAQGNHVVIGGDWNLELADLDNPPATEAYDRAWSGQFPHDRLPEGWQLVVDTRTPTVRTMQQPFVPGQNHVMIIDGFVISPNVTVEEVAALNLGFAFTDHHPVTARFLARQPG